MRHAEADQEARTRAWIPGLGHLILGRPGRGIRLILFTLGVVLLMAWRWDPFFGAFSTPFLDRWVASIFLILML